MNPARAETVLNQGLSCINKKPMIEYLLRYHLRNTHHGFYIVGANSENFPLSASMVVMSCIRVQR